MRKQIREQLLEMFPAIRDGINHAVKNKNTAETVLTDCYAAVETIGGALELSLSAERFSQYNEGLNALKAMLEFLLESILNNENATEVSKDIKEQIKLIKKELENESEVKLEIVFMPYKASMWDALESIWLAAKGDPNCDAYVIPIPYYDRNSDSSFGKLNYEGEDFPDYVDVLHYDDYNLELRKPDIIYIINPYDEGNYVTSVAPQFYSYELKKHTDMLVYVPYFVSGENVQEHFCAVSAVKYADKIIVQSEAIKKTYEKYAGRGKVVAFGSPKIDKVVNSKREDFTLPDNWKKIIENKKVVFYNTSVGSLLKGDKQYLVKLRSVLETFKERDDVALWWRPHPLSETTYKSMRPQLLREYLEIVEDYKRQCWGIYDDVPSGLHMAIAWTDAYYGDGSSVAGMYSITGKPVLYQNPNNSNLTDVIKNISFLSFNIKDNIVWGVSNKINGLFSFDLRTKTLKFHGEMPGERMFEQFLFSTVTIKENNIYLIPLLAKSVAKFNVSESTFDLYEIENINKNKFFDSYEYEGNIYLIPQFYPALLKYNIETGKITGNKKICSELDKIKTTENDAYFFRGGVLNGEYLMLASSVGNVMVKYNLKTDRHKVLRIGDAQNKYLFMTHDANDYWLFTFKAGIVKWNEETGEITSLDEFPDNFIEGDLYNFNGCVVYEENIFVFPSQSNMILKINTKTNGIETFINLDERERCASFSPARDKYYHAERFGDYIYAYSSYENCLQKINPKTGEIENIPLVLSDEDYALIRAKSLFNPPPGITDNPFSMFENSIVNLPFFLDKLVAETINKEQISFESVSENINNIDGTCGGKTHEYIKSLVK